MKKYDKIVGSILKKEIRFELNLFHNRGEFLVLVML